MRVSLSYVFKCIFSSGYLISKKANIHLCFMFVFVLLLFLAFVFVISSHRVKLLIITEYLHQEVPMWTYSSMSDEFSIAKKS